MDEGVTMSRREVDRLEVIQRAVGRQIGQGDAARQLGLSVRQVKRLVRAYRREGAAGLVSRRRGRPSNRRIAEADKDRFIDLVRRQYPDFGPTLAAEYLAGEHGFAYSIETLRGWMIEADLWRARRGRRSRPHPPRERRPCRGELVQIDASPHAWFEDRGPRCTLIAFIDDATGEVLAGRFVAVESSRAYLDVLADYVGRHGRPVALYSDRHSIFTKHDPEDPEPTQFERALSELDIASIRALTPQAKGRVERLFQTLQDRLVKALRLARIGDLEAANAYLAEYLARHNDRFAVAAAQPNDAHRPWRGGDAELARICTLHYRRTLSKNLVVRYGGQRYIIQTSAGAPRYTLRGRTVTVCHYNDDTVELLHGDEVLPWRVFDPACDGPHQRIADDKTVNDLVEQAVERLKQRPPKPRATHPWRKSFRPEHTRASAEPTA